MDARTTNRVLKIIADNSGANESSIELTHSLESNLFCDSLDRIEIALGLEEEFGISIVEDDFAKCETVQQIIEYVADVCNRKPMPSIFCITHHLACNCREQKVATLIKANLDAVMELDWLKNELNLSGEKLQAIQDVIERGHRACEALGIPKEAACATI
ncbi:acyl carrier protein [mine drainage metagenome]|uniref:Acyl carrier protein n=1 Tax=mine drainage metagenome TaxID=410659 RepID=A0A1J5TB36_9ZZZZ